MTEAKRKKAAIPDAASFSSPDAAGWLFKLIHDGWLSKKYKKRYCVLSGGVLYFYEFQTSKGLDKNCGSIDLKLYGKCTDGIKKEIKKNPTTFALEGKDPPSNSNKSQKRAHRELFYAEDAQDKTQWMTKLNEAISLSAIGGDTKLKHVTKTRAKPPGGPAGKRRPPTRNHLKERALLSEVALDDLEPKQPKEKRGKQPTSAIKPPPLKKLSPRKSQLPSPLQSPDLPPPPPETLEDEEEPLPSPPPPPIPSTDKKPKLKEQINVKKSNSSSSSHSQISSILSSMSSKNPSRASSRGKGDEEDHFFPPPPTDMELHRCNSDKLPTLVKLRDHEVTNERMAKAKSMIDVDHIEENNNKKDVNKRNKKIKSDKKKDKKQKKDKKEKKKSRPNSLVIL